MWNVDPTLDVLTKAVEVAALRHAVHASNVANANVEDYQRLEVQFAAESLSAGEVGTLTPKALQETSQTDPEIAVSTDGQVRLDEEMAQMSQNALRYQALLSAFERTVGLLRAAARDGRGEG
jgi:flagellar basal-body rod protein FlgB